MLKNILILFLIMLAINQKTAMAESSRDNKSIIFRTVIRDILLSTPSSIDRICIDVEGDTSNEELRGRKLLALKDLDNRIVTDDSTCLPQQLPNNKRSEQIVYSANLGSMIKELPKPSDKQDEEVYDKMTKHLKEGDLLVGADIVKCGGDERIYAFRISKNGPQLVESGVTGSVKCVSEDLCDNVDSRCRK